MASVTAPASEHPFGEPTAEFLASATTTQAPSTSASLADTLDSLVDFLRQYVVLPSDAAADAVALYVVHTYAMHAAETTPYLLVTSAEMRSGKTRLLELLELLCSTPKRSANASEAALFHIIGRGHTLLIDEVDRTYERSSRDTAGLTGILNAGYRRGAVVMRMGGRDNDEVREFPVFGAKVIAGIDNGRLPNTVRDRSVEIVMVRKRAGEGDEKRFRRADALVAANQLSAAVRAWTQTNESALMLNRPEVPRELDDRKAEAVEPLLAIADLAGGDWPDRARSAVVELAAGSHDDGVAHGTLILGKTREIIGERNCIPTRDLLAALNTDEQLPFGAWNSGSGITPHFIAAQLKPYGIKPEQRRDLDGRKLRGYWRDDLADLWARYLR